MRLYRHPTIPALLAHQHHSLSHPLLSLSRERSRRERVSALPLSAGRSGRLSLIPFGNPPPLHSRTHAHSTPTRMHARARHRDKSTRPFPFPSPHLRPCQCVLCATSFALPLNLHRPCRPCSLVRKLLMGGRAVASSHCAPLSVPGQPLLRSSSPPRPSPFGLWILRRLLPPHPPRARSLLPPPLPSPPRT